MKKIYGLLFFLAFGTVYISGQIGDGCHVYIVDVSAVEKADEANTDCTIAKNQSKCGVTTFPEFKPSHGEEELTTKSYKFPSSSLMITANVIFTDEQLASSNHGRDSVFISITLAPNVLKDVLSDENSAVAEFSDTGGADAMRVKRYYKINGKSYLVGMECHFKKLALR